MTRQVVDSMKIQRLIDGELSHADRAELLQQIDESPEPCRAEKWREVALALVEDRAFEKEIRRGAPSVEDTVRMPMLQAALDTHVDLKCLPKQTTPVVASVSSQGMKPSFMVAACLALMTLGFAGGSFLRGRWNPSDQADDLLVNQNLVEAGKLRWVAEDKTERELPVYQVSELDSATVLGANISDIERLQRRLMQNGVQLDVETEFLEAPLPDGRQLVVPVRNVNLRSLGQ